MAEALSGKSYLRLVLLGAAIGIPAALVAALFLALVHEAQHWLWTDLSEALGYDTPPWYLVLGLPVVGAAIVLLARRLLPGDGGHEPLEGLSTAPTPVSYAPGVALAAFGTLAFGAVLGPEAPVIALGSVVGVLVTKFVTMGKQETAVISTAGEFSAISALFGGPIVAGALLVEAGVGLGANLLPILLPGLVAAAVGYLIFTGFGDWGGLDAPGLSVPDLPAYTGVHAPDLVVSIIVGVVAALVLAVARRGGHGMRGLTGRLGLPVTLLGGGLAVGVLALLARALGANSQDVLFSGQSSVGVVATADSAKIVLILLAAKFLAYAVCLGCGFRGGPIFPAIFLGVALASLPVVWFGMSPTLAVAAGAAAGMAAQTKLLLSPLVLATLLVGAGAIDALPATVLATAAAWIATVFLEKRRAAEPAPA
ncbi:MAG: chloride channel protein [Hamadaea sp.]|nr:chloride channel protein [Hamadaea sp.]